MDIDVVPAEANALPRPGTRRVLQGLDANAVDQRPKIPQVTLILGNTDVLTFTPGGLSAFPLILDEFQKYLNGGAGPSLRWLEFAIDEKRLIAIHVRRSVKAFKAILQHDQGEPLTSIINESDPETAALIWKECIHYQHYALAQHIFLLTRLMWKKCIFPDTLPYSSAMKDAPPPIMSTLLTKNYFPAAIFSTAGSTKHSVNGLLLEEEINYSDRHWLVGQDVAPWTKSEPVQMRDPFNSAGYPVRIIERNDVFSKSTSPDLLAFVNRAISRLDTQLVLCCVTDGTAAAMGETFCTGSADGALEYRATDESREIKTVTYQKTCEFDVPIGPRTDDKLRCSMELLFSLQIPDSRPFHKLLEPNTAKTTFSTKEIIEGQKAAEYLILYVTATSCKLDYVWKGGMREDPGVNTIRQIANEAIWSRRKIGNWYLQKTSHYHGT
jgi:hypothetical protein